MEKLYVKMIILALPLLTIAVLSFAGCEEYGHHHRAQGGYNSDSNDRHGGNQGTCYERVLNIDKKTGQTHYEDRAVPCNK